MAASPARPASSSPPETSCRWSAPFRRISPTLTGAGPLQAPVRLVVPAADRAGHHARSRRYRQCGAVLVLQCVRGSPAAYRARLAARPDGSLKDTSAHIRDIGSFIVNLVDEALAERMNICAVDFPPGMSEIDAAGLTRCPAFRSRCRGSRRRRHRWSVATIRRWRSARAPPVRRRGRLPARAGRHRRSCTHVREPGCLPAGGALVR